MSTYAVTASSAPGGEGHIEVFGRDLRFDAARDLDHPGPAEVAGELVVMESFDV